ncbi:ubiquinol-cytochrome C reductase [Leptotrichia sp. OH3620_COT-345]|uniref:ubiquinol-cytochrome C reductase n=1 Tax=Leptotrichia sp. OH3620_COT-345 TaxID=2491048 RepID=UPI000F651363|nr:ubiquinol-cytochrome C reductase [Leptotrichia sp. OH3620_COT-345]RRD39519.1 ubiquinol-cytochrome C reductase [Leptotrichia sp. OH3620_COT-345]
MKKWFLVGMLIFGVIGFAKDRFVEKCEITSKGVYKNGVRYVNCISRATGRHFNFINVEEFTYQDMDKGTAYVIHFRGNGYRNLKILTHDYPLN